MKGEAIPDSDHVGRYCGARTVDNGEISAAAFMLRNTEEYLSVNWLEELKRPNYSDTRVAGTLRQKVEGWGYGSDSNSQHWDFPK